MSSRPVSHRQVLEELLDIWDQAQITRTDAQLVRHPEDRIRVGVIVRGLAAHAVDCGRGVLTLYQASQPVPAIPLVRCLMEDAVTAIWVHAVEDAWRSFSSDGAKSRARALREMQELDPSDLVAGERLAETKKLLEMLGPASGHLIQQRMQAIEGGENWYLLYRAASAWTHAGVPIVDLYTEVDERSEIGMSARPHAAFPNASAYIALAATYLLHTLAIWDHCQADRPDRDRLEEINRRLGLSPTYKARAS